MRPIRSLGTLPACYMPQPTATTKWEKSTVTEAYSKVTDTFISSEAVVSPQILCRVAPHTRNIPSRTNILMSFETAQLYQHNSKNVALSTDATEHLMIWLAQHHATTRHTTPLKFGQAQAGPGLYNMCSTRVSTVCHQQAVQRSTAHRQHTRGQQLKIEVSVGHDLVSLMLALQPVTQVLGTLLDGVSSIAVKGRQDGRRDNRQDSRQRSAC